MTKNLYRDRGSLKFSWAREGVHRFSLVKTCSKWEAKLYPRRCFGGKMVSWDGLWGVRGKLGVHRASWGIPAGTFCRFGISLRSSVGPWVVFEGQLDILFRLKVPLRTRLRAIGKSTRRPHGKLISEAACFNLGGKTPPGAISRTVLGFSIGKKLL